MKVRFEGCELDTDACVLYRAGRPVSVQPLVLRALAYLIENRQRVVGKDELRDAVWGGVSVGPGSFNQAVSLIRKAIGDDSASPAMIKTVRGLGYQFVAQVEGPAAPAPSVPRPSQRDIVGRDAELALLEGAFTEVLDEGARLVLVEGEPGIGKSTLLEAAAERLTRRGAWVLWASCREDKTRVPFWPFEHVLRALLESPFVDAAASDLSGARGKLFEMFPDLRPAGNVRLPPGPESAGRRLAGFEAVAEIMASACERQPVALMFDDLHCADLQSLRLLEQLLARLGRARLFACASHRTGEAIGSDPLDVPDAHQVVLRGLSRRASSELLRRRTGQTPSDAVLDASMRLTVGSPLLLGEVARVVSSAESSSALARLESRFRAPESGTLAARGFVEALPESAREIGRVASVLGRQFTMRRLAPLAERTPAECAALLAPILDAGLLLREGADHYAFAHDLFRHALYQSAGNLGELHARAASLFADDPENPENVFIAAHHHRLGLERTDPQRAFAALRLAAERSFDRAAFEDAATYFDHAAEARALAPDPARDVGEILVRRGHALRCAGKPSAAIACFMKAAGHARTLGDGALFVAAALGYGITHKGFFDFQLIALLREANDKHGPHDPTVQAQLWTELAFALRQTAEQRNALAFAQQALAHARAAGNPSLLARALTAERWNAVESRPMTELVAISREALAAATTASDLSLVNDARLCLAWDLMLLGDADGLEREIHAYRSTSEQLRHGYDLLIVARFEAVRALIGGNFEHAEALAKEALRLGRAGGDSTTDIVFSIEILIPMRETGRLPELEKFIRFMEAVAPKPNVWGAAAAMMLAEAGRTDEATKELATLAAGISKAERDFNYLPMIALLAEACWRIGDAELAALLAEELRGYLDRHLVMGGASLYFGAVQRYFGLALGAAGNLPDALAALEAGVVAARTMQSPYWVARTELDLARLAADRSLAARVRDDAVRAGWATIAREAAALC